MLSDEEKLAQELLRFRVINDMTQEEFAKKCGIARCTVVLAEKGNANISKKMRTKIMLFIENNQ